MKKLFNDNVLLSLLIPAIFLIVGVLTLGDYGINWDEPIHIIRGHAYLNFILTGKHNFLDFPAYPALKGAPDIVDFNVGDATNSGVVKHGEVKDPNIRRSYYQSDFYTFDYFMTKHIHTHPEVNDLLVALSNLVFFQKLGLVGDIEAHHLFVVLTTFALAIGVALWVYYQFGIFASTVASFSLVFYPLVFSESHFNIKDPVLMSFFGLAILSFWLGFSKKKAILIYLSAILAGFSLGTKFNTFFLVFILGPWAICYMYLHYKKGMSLVGLIGGKKIMISLLSYPLIMFLILYIFSPYLWQKPVGNFMQIVNYYKEIGIGTPVEQSKYLVGGWNTYPLVWIAYTTPLPILFLSIIGFCYAVFLFLIKRKEIALLILLWLIVPILRSIWPGMNIYGGVRQIMEFIPAMAILSGVGAVYLVNVLKNYFHNLVALRLIAILIIISLIFTVFELKKIHPNENVYFNQLAGGLWGAYEKNIPSWGNSYGNVYLQGINWLNKNAEVNTKLALPVNYISSIPRLKLRSDIDLDNHYFSGQKKEGEYAMEMYYDWPLKSKYKYAYYETFLNPVYQVVVDGVPLLKIWKNDLEHTRRGFEQEVQITPISVKVMQQRLKIDFEDQVYLTKLIVWHSNTDCESQLGEGFLAVSKDNQDFVREPDPLIDLESPESTLGMDETTFVHRFPARPARSVIFNPRNPQSCILKNINVTVMVLKR